MKELRARADAIIAMMESVKKQAAGMTKTEKIGTTRQLEQLQASWDEIVMKGYNNVED